MSITVRSWFIHHGKIYQVNGILSCTGSLCELDATPSICVDIAFTEQRVRCAVNLLIHRIYTVFISISIWDIPYLYSTYPHIAGHCGHSSSLSIHPARPIGRTYRRLLVCSPSALLHLPCATQARQTTDQDQLHTLPQ